MLPVVVMPFPSPKRGKITVPAVFAQKGQG